MGRIIAIANQKGGVGKTTTGVNLAASIATMGRRVLLVDMDPQGNATTGSGIDKNRLKHSSCDVLFGDVSLEEAVLDAPNGAYQLVPSNGDLTAAEVGLMKAPLKERRLKLALKQAGRIYDFIFVDCPPSLNMLTVNALVAANGVIIPIQCEYYALEGLSSLLDTIAKVRDRLNRELQIEGILRTMHDPRNNLANEVSAQLITHFGAQVYRTIIPRNVRLAESPSHGLPVIDYDKSSRGAIAYLALGSEVLRRNRESPVAAAGLTNG